MWEIRKLFPVTLVVAVIRIAAFPTARPKPSRVYIDDDDNVPNLSVVLDTYRCKEQSASYAKKMCKLIADEITQRLMSGDLLKRSSLYSTFSSRDIGLSSQFFDRKYYSKPAPMCIDSSEMEYTTFIEVPRQQPLKQSPESPHDFSSTTTDDEDESPSAAEDLQPLNRASSLTSISSCVGIEYEEAKPPQMEMLTQAEVTELTASFTTVSDDTSVDDVTVIFRPPSMTVIDPIEDDDAKSHFSDGNKSIGSFSLSSIEEDENQLSDSNTYSRLADVDFEDSLHDAVAIDTIPSEECSTSFIGKDPIFKMELSVIYEEHGNVLAESVTEEIIDCTKDDKCEVYARPSMNADLLSAYAKLEPEKEVTYVPHPQSPSVTSKLDFTSTKSSTTSMEVLSDLAETNVDPVNITYSFEYNYDHLNDGSGIQPLARCDHFSIEEPSPCLATVDSDPPYIVETHSNAYVYNVLDMIDKFSLCAAYVLNIVSGFKVPGDGILGDNSKVIFPDSHNDLNTDTYSSAAFVQHNSNSEAHTISDTSLISCIVDSYDDVVAAKLTPSLDGCSELYPLDSGILTDDIEAITCCSEILDDENTDDKDDSAEPVIEGVDVSYDETGYNILESISSDRSLSPNFNHSVQNENAVSVSASATYVVFKNDIENDADSCCSCSSPAMILENCDDFLVNADKITSSAVGSLETINDQTSKLSIGPSSFKKSDVQPERIDYFNNDILDVAILKTTNFDNTSANLGEVIKVLNNRSIDKQKEIHAGNGQNTDANVPNITYDVTKEILPSDQSSCDVFEVDYESSDYFNIVDNTVSPQLVTVDVTVVKSDDSCLEEPHLNQKSSHSFIANKDDVLFSQSTSPDVGYENFENNAVFRNLSVDEEQNALLNHDKESKTDIDIAPWTNLMSENYNFANVFLKQRVIAFENEDSLSVSETVSAFANSNIIAQRMQANADVICLSFDNFSLTDISFTKRASDEESEIDKQKVQSSHYASPEISEVPFMESGCDSIAWLFETDISIEGLSDLSLKECDRTEFVDTCENFDICSDEDEFNRSYGSTPRTFLESSANILTHSEEDEHKNGAVKFRTDAHLDFAKEGDCMLDTIISNSIDTDTLEDSFDWLFCNNYDLLPSTSSESVENDEDMPIDINFNDPDAPNVSDAKGYEECDEPTLGSCVECAPDESVTYPDVEEFVDDLWSSDSYELIGQLFCDDSINYSYVSDGSKIEYDVNRNQITTDENESGAGPGEQPDNASSTITSNGADTKQRRQSCTGELSLKLRLKLEWDNRPRSSHECSNSSSSSRGGEKQSSFEDDSLDSNSESVTGVNAGVNFDTATSGAAGTTYTPCSPSAHHRSPHSKLLVEFKHNYPKFIQYSYFSPKVRIRRSPKRTPQTMPSTRVRKCDANTGLKSACKSVDSIKIRETYRKSSENSDGEYFRFTNVSTDWPTFARLRQSCSGLAATTDEAIKSSLLNSNPQSLSFKTSTPISQHMNEFGSTCVAPSPIISSLEEFEILESLLEADKESMTR